MDGYESIVRRFPMPKYQVAIVHGRMKPEDKAWEMDRFAKGQAQILVATTVIEVVNVPNASVMVIEFGAVWLVPTSPVARTRGRGASQSCAFDVQGGIGCGRPASPGNDVSNERRVRNRGSRHGIAAQAT